MAQSVDLSIAFKQLKELNLDLPYQKSIVLNEILYNLAHDQYVKGSDDASLIHNKYQQFLPPQRP